MVLLSVMESEWYYCLFSNQIGTIVCRLVLLSVMESDWFYCLLWNLIGIVVCSGI